MKGLVNNMAYSRRMTRIVKLSAVAISIFLFSFAFYGCIQDNDNSDSSTDIDTSGTNASTDINDAGLEDNDTIYMYDDEGSLTTMYLTVRQGNSSENTDHTWSEVNSYSIFDYEKLNIDRYGVEAILKIGDENGPVLGELGYGITIPNAIVRIRGNTTSRAPQKSFKIEIKKDNGLWREQRTIVLNKHPYDETRFVNKLCYDLMRDIPDLVSARTQFVHLYVKDETSSGAASAEYVDYGLFTQVEQFNTTFLKSHGLDENGQFYKAEMFEFLRYEDSLKLKSDPDYDVDTFEDVLEIKGDDDHTKLIAMLDDLNNYSIDIETTFEKYFDEDNYFTWMAFNILNGNVDSINRNFYLYSPLTSNTFYFISWDIDGAFSRTIGEYQGESADYGYNLGISNYWGCVLHERVLSNAKYRQILSEKIEEVRGYLSREKISELINAYKPVVKNFISIMPDMMHTEVTVDEYDGLLAAMMEEIDLNYSLYKNNIECPMPFYIDRPSYENEQIKYTWGVAFDFDSEEITYTVEIAKDLFFTEMIATFDAVEIPIVYTEKLATGQYFIRVKATNESGYSQYAMDYYSSESVKYYGVYDFYIQPDGTIDS